MRREGGGESGFSLGEVLTVTAIVGFLALMLAPTEAYLLRVLRAAQAPRAAGELSSAALRLGADARAAESWSRGIAGALHVRTPSGTESVWSVDSAGLTRTTFSAAGRVESLRRFPAVRDLRLSDEEGPLLSAVLVAHTGDERAVVAGLRNAGARR